MIKHLYKLFLLFSISCYSQTCYKLPPTFTSYARADQLINNTNFKIEESVNTSKSSWIRCAKYFSCDGKKGFFVLCTDQEDYTHQDLPIDVWRSFKSADSFGNYYNQHIKNKFQLKISSL